MKYFKEINMTDEQIEKAADEYAATTTENCLKPYSEAIRPLIYPEYDTNDLANAFAAGARFSLSHQWISVDERLPEDDSHFYFVVDARLAPLGVDCAEYTCETKLFSRNGKVLHPTHWMPIPQLNPEKQSI